MRVLLMWSSIEPEMKILLDTLKQEGHEIVYWVGIHATAYLTPPGTIFHNHYDAWDAKPASALAHEHILPANAELIASQYALESLVLTMMNKRYDKATVDERKHIYYTMLAYWNHVLDTVKPEAIIFNAIPHSIYSNVIYDLAQKRRIPALCSEPTWVGTRLVWYWDFWKGNAEIPAAIKRNRNRHIIANDLDEELRAYWEDHTKEAVRVAPPYFYLARKTGEGWGLARHRARIAWHALWRGDLFSLIAGYVRRIGKPNLKREHARACTAPDLHAPFVYFPLSFQPECTTSPQGGIYVDQILVAETLAAALPPRWELYIKEHPGQWWTRTKERYSSARYLGYYKRLAKIPRARLVPIATDSFELIEKSQAVAVVTGTVGWEALLRGKCPLVFGIPWYRDCPDIFRVDSVNSCAAAFEKIKNGVHAKKEDVLSFLKAVEEGSIRAYTADPMEKKLRYTPAENMHTLAAHISKLLAGVTARH